MASGTSQSWRDGMSSDNIKGLVLALSSSVFIGASFIVKKKGLKKAGASGIRAGVGGYSYLYEPLWWVGMITMIVGEIANFAAYAFAPAILVTPLGALSIIISAVLAHIILRERLHIFGILGCALCVVGSTTIVLHAPQEREIESVIEVWNLATEPAFLLYAALVTTAVFILIFQFIPEYGQTHIMVYIGICSLVGSLSVMSVKALGIALKLTLSGMNQLIYPQTWAFTLIVITCVITQMNYLNKVMTVSSLFLFMLDKLERDEEMMMRSLDLRKVLVVMFVTNFAYALPENFYSHWIMMGGILAARLSSWLSIDCGQLAVIRYKVLQFGRAGTGRKNCLPSNFHGKLVDWDRQNPTQIVTEMCGFVTILSGTFLLHKTKDMGDGTGLTTSMSLRLPKHADEDGFGSEGIPLRRQDSMRTP
ncbi:hypothetical protein Patl1_36803 [Pistacia atlantica]|nr:hypothetical protein Patl1_36803 [Pistacia atlantica]